MALPCAHAFVEKFKGDRLIAVIDPSQKALLERSNLPFEIWAFDKKKDRKALTQKLKTEKVESVYILTNSLGSYLPYWKARVKNRFGFGGKWTRHLLNRPANRDWLADPQGERWVKLIDPTLTTLDVQPLLSIKKDPTLKPHLLLFPGAKYGPSKQWDDKSYSKIIELAFDSNWEVSLYGTKEEIDIGAKIQNNLEQKLNVNFGTHNLKALMDHIETISNPVCLANDSGAMHLMSACGVPTLGLYFSTSAQNTPPAFGDYKILEADISCRPCYKRTCPLEHYQCREKINTQMVWNQLQSFN